MPHPTAAAADPFDRLRGHAVIAWDLDDTLLGHPASHAMHDFIRANPQIRHVIVTFRAAGGQERVWRDLGPNVSAQSFAGLEMIDETLSQSYSRLWRQRRGHLFAGPETRLESEYLAWKGSVCARWGARVLIDDMTAQVRQGCEIHGVTLLHPDVFM